MHTTTKRLRSLLAAGALIASTLAAIGVSVATAPPADACNGSCSNENAQMVSAIPVSGSYGANFVADIFMRDLSVGCTLNPFSDDCDVPVGDFIMAENGEEFVTDALETSGPYAGYSHSRLVYSGLHAGQRHLLFQYVPGQFASDSFTWDVDIAPAGSKTTMLPTTPGSSQVGQTVELSAKVEDLGGIQLNNGAHRPSGNISFLDGGSEFASAPIDINTGIATLNWSLLDAGPHTLSARYNTDFDYEASTSPNTVTHVVDAADSGSALTQTADTTVYGQPFTVTDTVTPVAPAVGTPTGQVQFWRGATAIAGVSLTGGVASTPPVLAVGTHALSATYAGDTNFKPSTSNTLSHTVNKADTTTALTSTPANSSTLGQSVTLNAAVAVTLPGAGVPGGSVQFKDGASNLGAPVTMSPGGASLTTAALGGGTHNITAVYSGDGNLNGSTSAALPHTVTCTNTVSGTVNGNYNVPATGTTCISNANITGGVNIPSGAKMSIVNSTLGGYVQAPSGAGTITICGSTIPGITVNNAAGRVTIGDPYTAGCTGNVISGGVGLASNHGGVRINGNRIGSGLNATGNNGGPTVIGGNTVTGWLQCSGNTSVTNEAHPNTAGGRTGQCATPANF